MDLTTGPAARSGPELDETGLDSIQFDEDIRHLITAPPENSSSFTALLELPDNQAVELLHSDSGQKQYPNLTFPSNTSLLERAARFSVFNGGSNSTDSSSVPSNSSSKNLEKEAAIKSEPLESESYLDSSQPLVSDPAVDNSALNVRACSKRKEREKKVKGASKKSKNESSQQEEEKLPYVHVRARRGQATDSHSLAERARREKINQRMKLLQELVPGCNKISGTALVLDEIINHVQFLQRQVEFLSMRLAAVDPTIDVNLDSIIEAESGSLIDSNFPSMIMPLMWPEAQVNRNRHQFQRQWQFDALHQPVWGREENSRNFITPENSLLSYDSSANSDQNNQTELAVKLEETTEDPKSPPMTTSLLKLITLLILFPLHQSHPSTSATPTTIQLPHTPPTTTLSVTDFGATGDGIQYDTQAIQSTINSCPSTPPTKTCHVNFPPGTYLTATIHLKSHVVLNIQEGATLLGGTKLEDYPKEFNRWYVVLAENVSDVGLTGGGVVDGQGLKFVKRFNERKNVMVSWNSTGACLGDECRPRLVGFIGCTNVKVWNVRLREPAYWCLHIVRCLNTSIFDVSIYGDFNSPNNDGIDIEDSNYTLIARCHIDTGDDAICPKTYTSPLYNLTARDSWIRTKSSAIKLGSASWFEFKGLVFDNITIVDSHRGLGLQIRDGGNVSDITFSNINISTRYYDPSWWGRAEPIYVTTCPRDSSSKEGSISNLQFINVTANSENGVFLSGSKGGLLSNLRIINMNLTYRRWTNYPGGLVDYRPGCQGLVNHSAAGIVMEYIEGFQVENVNMRWSNYQNEQWDNPLDFRPSTVNNISLLNFRSASYKQMK